MDFNNRNLGLLFYCVYCEIVTTKQNTTDASVSGGPKIICRHCVAQQTDSLVTEF